MVRSLSVVRFCAYSVLALLVSAVSLAQLGGEGFTDSDTPDTQVEEAQFDQSTLLHFMFLNDPGADNTRVCFVASNESTPLLCTSGIGETSLYRYAYPFNKPIEFGDIECSATEVSGGAAGDAFELFQVVIQKEGSTTQFLSAPTTYEVPLEATGNATVYTGDMGRVESPYNSSFHVLLSAFIDDPTSNLTQVRGRCTLEVFH